MKKIVCDNEEICIADQYVPVRLYREANGCCKDRPFVLTTNSCPVSPQRPSGVNYSCQCACGTWCTTGFAEEDDAVADYRRMTKEAEYREECSL